MEEKVIASWKYKKGVLDPKTAYLCYLAASTAARPRTAPSSSTRSSGRTLRWRQKKREPAFGGCTPSGTRKSASRQA